MSSSSARCPAPPTYAPMEDLARNHPGVGVAYRDIAPMAGMADPDRQLIVLRDSLPPLLHRVVLTHEIAHIRLGHRRTNNRARWEVHEIEASIDGSERLVDLHALRFGILHGMSLEEIAVGMLTTVSTLRWRIASATPAERSYILGRTTPVPAPRAS